MDTMLLRLARAAPINSSARSYLLQSAKSISLADRPVADAERVLRKALVAPNERKADLDAIAACSRLKAWLRKDHIDRRYRGSDRYVRAATSLRQLDARAPPALGELKKLFGLGGWAFDATDASLEDAARDEALGRLSTDFAAAAGTSPSTEALDYEALLEAAGCAVSGRSEVNAYMESHEIYDFYTAEYVAELADHLVETKSDLGVDKLDVVEVGAGDGRLSQFLRGALEERGQSEAVAVTATDDRSWRFAPAFPVEDVGAARAAENAHVAIAAWMPPGADWTAAWRAHSKLAEYVVIGEAWDGCCGHNWRTHGNPTFSDEASEPRPDRVGGQTPYARDGFEKRELRDLSKLQLSRYDCKPFAGSSKTFSFRRRGSTWAKRRMSTWTKRTVDLKVPSAPGFTVRYAVRGAGAPVVAVHCSGSSHKQWAPLCDALPNHRVVAPNLFGAGGTTPWPPHGRPQTLDDTAALVEAAVNEALGEDADTAIIVGHSHGAAVALRYAATRDVAGVVLVEPNYMSLLEAAAAFDDDKADEAARNGGVDDAAAFLGRMMASAQSGYGGWGACFHRFWLAEEEGDRWADVPEPQQKVLLDLTIPHCAYEIGSIAGARGDPASRDLVGLARLPGAKHLVLSARPGVGSQRCLAGLRAVLERAGFETSTLREGGHLAPLTHAAATAEHLARLVGACGIPEN